MRRFQFNLRDVAWLLTILTVIVAWWVSQQNLKSENAYLRTLVMPTYARDHGLTPGDALEMMQREAQGDLSDATK